MKNWNSKRQIFDSVDPFIQNLNILLQFEEKNPIFYLMYILSNKERVKCSKKYKTLTWGHLRISSHMFDEKVTCLGKLFSFLNIILHKFFSVRMENFSDPVIEPIPASWEINRKPSCSFRFKPVRAVWTTRPVLGTDWSRSVRKDWEKTSFSPGCIKLAEMGWSWILPFILTLGCGMSISINFGRRDSVRSTVPAMIF